MNYLFRPVRSGIGAAFFVFVLAKTPRHIRGDAGVNTAAATLEKIDEIH